MAQNPTVPASAPRRGYRQLRAAKRARARAEEVAAVRWVRALNRGLPRDAVTAARRRYVESCNAEVAR